MNTDPDTADADAGQKKKARSAAAADAARRGRGFGRPGGWQNVDLPPADDAQAWFEGRLPSEWFTDVTVTVDREEITVVGTLADETADDGAAAEGRISRFRADTRATRMEIADEAQARYGARSPGGRGSARPGRCSPTSRCR